MLVNTSNKNSVQGNMQSFFPMSSFTFAFIVCLLLFFLSNILIFCPFTLSGMLVTIGDKISGLIPVHQPWAALSRRLRKASYIYPSELIALTICSRLDRRCRCASPCVSDSASYDLVYLLPR